MWLDGADCAKAANLVEGVFPVGVSRRRRGTCCILRQAVPSKSLIASITRASGGRLGGRPTGDSLIRRLHDFRLDIRRRAWR